MTTINQLIDKNGNPIPLGAISTPTAKQVKNAVLELIVSGEVTIEQLGGSTGQSKPLIILNDEGFKANAQISLELLTTEIANYDYSCIPIWAITDTHNMLPVDDNYDIGQYINDISPQGLMALFLGDICDTVFSPTYALANYRNHVDAFDKVISVVGNHDRATNSQTDSDKIATHTNINKFFITEGFERADDVLYGSYNDVDYTVRYLVLNPYEIVPMENGEKVRIGTKQMSWLIKNLTECDRDIIILMHQLFNDLHIHRDGTKQTWGDAPTILQKVWNMLKDRKNKRSGTITDSDNVVHNYDFSNCESDLLCCLHGHTHEELYIQDEGLLAYAFDYGCQKNCAFVSVNRAENKLKVAQFNPTTVRDRLELALSSKNSIINKLTNVTSSNMATTGVDTNLSYTTTITANEGYTLSSIVVKMNGIDISSTAVSGNAITINNVVGRVEITASATATTE